MKKIFIVSMLAALIFSSCKKEHSLKVPDRGIVIPESYLSNVSKYVRQHPRFVDGNEIDFSNYSVSKQKAHWYLRLSFKNKSSVNDFVVLQTDSLGNTSDGRLVHLEQEIAENRRKSPLDFTGSIDITNVDGQLVLHSPLTTGFIHSFHPRLFTTATITAREESVPVPYPYSELPEVIVVAYTPATNSGGGISISNYMMLQSLFNRPGASYNDGLGPNAVTGGSTVYSYLNGGSWQPVQDQASPPPNIAVDPENSYLHPAIDINAWLKCFAEIPDAGASCSLTLLGDLPVDNDPTKGMNLWSGNTGHCFLQLTKTNGVQSVTQVIGFTAHSPLNAIANTEAFVPGKTVDNAGHKFDCSITMNLTPEGMRTVVNKMKSLGGSMQYSVVNYDCLDYGLDVFNSVRALNPLRVSKVFSVSDPFSNIANGPKLYEVLEDMVANGSPEAPNIMIGGPRYAGESHGACN